MGKYMIDSYKQRKRAWKHNAIRSPFLRLTKNLRDKKIWIFGCWNGTKYDDNSRFLFEYVSNFHDEINAIWISREKDIVDVVSKKGYKALLSTTKEGKKAMRKAGVAFYTNTLSDFSDIPLVYGATIVNLNHGAGPLKFLRYRTQFQDGSLKQHIKKIYDHIMKDLLFDWLYFDYVLTPCKALLVPVMDCFSKYDRKKYLMIGMPRSDVFVYDYWEDDTFSYLNAGFKYILFMPTYRPYKNSIIKNLIDIINKNKSFNELLANGKIKIIIKPHPIDNMSEYSSINNSNIFVFNNILVPSQFLLKHSAILITDYSNVCIDYAIARKPIVFFAPDWEKYSEINGLNEMWKDRIFPYCKTNPIDVINECVQIINNGMQPNETTEALFSIFGDCVKDKPNCEQIINAIKAIQYNRRTNK